MPVAAVATWAAHSRSSISLAAVCLDTLVSCLPLPWTRPPAPTGSRSQASPLPGSSPPPPPTRITNDCRTINRTFLQPAPKPNRQAGNAFLTLPYVEISRSCDRFSQKHRRIRCPSSPATAVGEMSNDVMAHRPLLPGTALRRLSRHVNSIRQGVPHPPIRVRIPISDDGPSKDEKWQDRSQHANSDVLVMIWCDKAWPRIVRLCAHTFMVLFPTDSRRWLEWRVPNRGDDARAADVLRDWVQSFEASCPRRFVDTQWVFLGFFHSPLLVHLGPTIFISSFYLHPWSASLVIFVRGSDPAYVSLRFLFLTTFLLFRSYRVDAIISPSRASLMISFFVFSLGNPPFCYRSEVGCHVLARSSYQLLPLRTERGHFGIHLPSPLSNGHVSPVEALRCCSLVGSNLTQFTCSETALDEHILQPNRLGHAASHRGYYGTALRAACNKGELEAVNLLLEHGADPNLTGGHWGSALHACACYDYVDCARALLEHGADPNVRNKDGDTPLHDACTEGYTKVAELLLDFGVDPTIRNNDGETALQQAMRHKGGSEIVRMLHRRGVTK
ncbi:hypothetical protein NMY22_g18503 [Coprinellus aureogranulatus]|nr:hypothetical protein NMY22_g18503 [Coprinellus aureogranulatus]